MGTLVKAGPAGAIRMVCGIGNRGAPAPVVTASKTAIAPADRKSLISKTTLHSSSSKRLFSLSLQLYRFAHTDVRFPDFNDRRITTDPTKAAKITEDARRMVQQGIMYGIGGAFSLFAATKLIHSIVYFKSMPADQVALGSTEINLSEIPEGQCKTYAWRGKPLFVKHRTAEEIEQARNVNLSELRDPQDDSARVQRPEWLVLLGVCPHLGCVPIHGKGEYNAWLCPCHSTSFDMSGRVRLGPAPTNLEVPPYKFRGDDVLVVGEE